MTPKRPNETVTQFSTRLIRNEILERAIKACEEQRSRADNLGVWDVETAYNLALDHAIDAIRALQEQE